MTIFNWNQEKNQQLLKQRNITFEEIVYLIQHGHLLDDIKHPNQADYPNQRLLVVEIDGYAYLVPYVEDGDEIFLKTIFPSRKATRRYLGDKP